MNAKELALILSSMPPQTEVKIRSESGIGSVPIDAVMVGTVPGGVGVIIVPLGAKR